MCSRVLSASYKKHRLVVSLITGNTTFDYLVKVLYVRFLHCKDTILCLTNGWEMLKQMVGRYFETKDPALRLSPTSLRELMVID